MKSRHWRRIGAVVGLASSAAWAAGGDEPGAAVSVGPGDWVMLGRDLKPTPVALVTLITPGEVHYLLKAAGEEQKVARDEVLALVPAGWLTRPPARAWSQFPGDHSSGASASGGGAGVMELTDGTRLVGAPAQTPGPDPEHLAWTHPLLNRVVVKIDRLRRLRFEQPGPDAEGGAVRSPDGGSRAATGGTPEAATSDRVHLVNGDVLQGLVSGIGRSSAGAMQVTIEPLSGGGGAAGAGDGADAGAGGGALGGGEGPRSIPLDRVAGIQLANPLSPPPAARVWLADGSVVGCEQVTMRERQVLQMRVVDRRAGAEEGEGAPAEINLAHARALALDDGRVRALCDLPIESTGARMPHMRAMPVRVDRDENRPDPLGASDVLLPMPLVVTWTLPERSVRLGGVLVLPEGSRKHGDCVVTVRAAGAGEGGAGAGEGKPLVKARLNAETPRVEFVATLPAGAASLVVDVDPGASPVQDAVVIQRGVVVTE